MSTRREAALALLGLPLIATAAPGGQPELKAEFRPYSEISTRIVSYTLYAEARGEPFKGKMAVASVIKTRAVRSKISLAATCMQDQQFSCWNGLKAVPDFYISGEGILSEDLQARTECYGIAWFLMTDKLKWDYLTHFYNPAKATPDWAKDLKGIRTIGRHVFGYIN